MAIADDIKKLEEFLATGGQRYVYEGKTYSFTDAQKLLADLREKQKPITKADKDKTKNIQEAEKAVKRLQEKLEITLDVFNKPEEYVSRVTEADIRKAQNDLRFANESLARLTSQTDEVLISRNLALNTRAEDARLLALSSEAKKSGQQLVGTTEKVLAPTTPKEGKPVVVTKAQVDKKLVELNLPDTPENRKVARQGLKAGTTAQPGAEDRSWEPIFKQNYPQYNWMFTDLDRTKYSDVFDLFSKAIDPKTGKLVFEDAEFERRWKGTSFYGELETSKKGRELSASIGNFTWGSGQLAKFLTKAIQFGYEGENLKQQAYKDLFTKVDNKYVNDLAVGEVKASSPYLALKRIGTQYLTSFEDQTVENALTGGISSDDLLRKARVLAGEKYPHLKDAINAGVTLEELAADYKQVAARTLELDPSQIDMGGIYNVAIKSGEGGKERMLSTSEWETLLRTDSKFKYSFTKQANQDATNIGLSIARAFGKVG